jgi:hypothetical protein
MPIVGYGRMALVFLMLRVGIVLICTATLAHAQWSKEQLSVYTEDCVKSCSTRAKDGHKCPSACACVARDLQAQFPDYVALEREHDKPDSAVAQRFNSVVLACRRRIFGE